LARRLDATYAVDPGAIMLRGVGAILFLAGLPLAMASLALFVLGLHQS
jgi:hypothetical protein